VSSLSEALQPFSAIIVTGGSSGIGRSFIKLGRKLRPDLFFCNLSRSAPREIISADARKYLNHFSCDLARSSEVERDAGELRTFLTREAPAGPILLINNSGIGAFGRFPEPDLEHELRMVDLNVRAVVQLTGLLLPVLRERGGAVMNIASTVAFQPTAMCATYGATKAFVLNWTVALNEELRGTNVLALAVCPGTTKTEFFERAGVGAGGAAAFAMTSDEVAEIALRALAGKKALVVTGWKNKLLTWAGARVAKTFAARVSAWMLTKMRLSDDDGRKGGAA